MVPTEHVCAHSQCHNNATHVVIEGKGKPENQLLFKTGAGLCCDDHTREYSQMGGVPMPLDMFFEVASDRA